MSRAPRIVALSGGVGGARFVHGLAAALAPAAAAADASASAGAAEQLTVIVNTGDDFRWWGLAISPDLDTVMYTLAGLSDDERGWGLRGESFAALSMVAAYGGETWFQLGDRDLATHLQRSEALARGDSLSAVTARLCARLGVGPRVLPMADAPRQTRIDTAEHGSLLFQEWFVRERTRPRPERIWFEGTTTPAPAAMEALAEADLVLIGPSNPYVSIDPMLGLDGVREALARVPVVAVSPIVGGRAVKGPLAEMIPQLAGRPASAAAVCAHYQERWDGLLRGFVVESDDASEITELPVLGTDTIMRDHAARARLARATLAFAESLR
ncbi:2-phospho-L-lactate transferase [Haliangium ochraceum]|uniref:LPPG domain protein containing protein n=1 Tax=Haliangium ochraceum (strain DSM 14365 / JCM 11303 / SMP-2) TaxID=502025 RepID=D0LGF5_HALO1|nr:2-phospho-L-lactate transferase [Haliangium ochraceum]ACY12701.1 LPPG domain protein containing protein [Haliangium ochraceum DSM 14365]